MCLTLWQSLLTQWSGTLSACIAVIQSNLQGKTKSVHVQRVYTILVITSSKHLSQKNRAERGIIDFTKLLLLQTA